MSEKSEDRGQKTEDKSWTLKTTSRLILLIVVVLSVGILVVRNISITKNILLVMLGFGAVVIVHEFGHFVIAKLFGIKVEAFSIFMPPMLMGITKVERGWRVRILPELLRKGEDKNSEELLSFTFGKKILPGETEYRIGLIPFGGFVKMLGQDDVGPVKQNDDPRSFANKPALVRAAVLAAGVIFNVISAAAVFMMVFLIGIRLTGPVVGGVIPNSPAERAGIVAGDEVIEIRGKDGLLDFSDIMTAGALSGKGEEIPMKIRRENGDIEEISLVAEKLPGGQFRGFGIERPISLKIGRLLANDDSQLFAATGLLSGDHVRAVDGIDVNNYWQMGKIVADTFEPNVVLLVERLEPSGQTQLAEGYIEMAFPAAIEPGNDSQINIGNICGIVPRMKIAGVAEERQTFGNRIRGLFGIVDKKQRLEPGDIIVGFGDVENPTYLEIREITMANEGNQIDVVVLRNDANDLQQSVVVQVVPRKEADSGRIVVGIAPELDVEQAVVAKTISIEPNTRAPEMPSGARITAVDGVDVMSFFDVARELEKNAGQHITIDWRIDDQVAGNAAIDVPRAQEIVKVEGLLAQQVPFADLERLYKSESPIKAIATGYKKTKTFIVQTYITLQRLIGGLVSPKEIMGPVGILTFSYRIVAQQPIIYYIYFLGLISAAIAVFNFLPLPPLDGGLTVLLLIEKIKGSALSMRTQEIIAYLGWGLVGAFFLYVTFNDIVRSFFS